MKKVQIFFASGSLLLFELNDQSADNLEKWYRRTFFRSTFILNDRGHREKFIIQKSKISYIKFAQIKDGE